jgi:mono/diheme cytochrome c family protein
MGSRLVAMCAVMAAVGNSLAADCPERELGKEVRDLFAARCAGCHGPDLARPKGRFAYVTDLARLAGNPELVAPGRPDESELWELVRRNEMPPADSPTGPLTVGEKELVRAWITAGAPAAMPTPAARSANMPVALTTIDRLWRWLGKFHLLALHFPIALVLVAAVGEAHAAWRRSPPASSQAVRFCLGMAAAGAAPTAALGWLHAAAGNGIGSPQLLTAHRWLGTVTAAWLVLTALVVTRTASPVQPRAPVRWMLAGAVVLTVLTAHLGGLLGHGTDFFDW